MDGVATNFGGILIVSDDRNVVLDAALAGQGIIQQPTFLIGDDLRAGRLVPILPEWRGQAFGIHLVYPSRRFLPPKMRVLLAFLAERLGAARW